jgi:methionyl-tRNA synthetase
MYHARPRAAPIAEAYERNDRGHAIRQAWRWPTKANSYIDETKPWVIAKQDGADARTAGRVHPGSTVPRVVRRSSMPPCAQLAGHGTERL